LLDPDVLEKLGNVELGIEGKNMRSVHLIA